MLYVDGWDGMVIIVHRSFKSTFGANKCSDNKGCRGDFLRSRPNKKNDGKSKYHSNKSFDL